MRKIICLILSLILCSICLCGCADQNEKEEPEMITKEWLMKTYGITDDDLTGIDIELRQHRTEEN